MVKKNVKTAAYLGPKIERGEGKLQRFRVRREKWSIKPKLQKDEKKENPHRSEQVITNDFLQ